MNQEFNPPGLLPCWWRTGHFWSLQELGKMEECLWCGQRQLSQYVERVEASRMNGAATDDHFPGVTKMVDDSSGAATGSAENGGADADQA